jgi:rhamnosyltransferase
VPGTIRKEQVMNISIICPLYNGEKYIENLHSMLLKQEKVDLCSIDYILTETKDNSEEILKSIGASYKKIGPSEFSHSKTREEAVYNAAGDIVVLITQDILIKDCVWLYNLTNPIANGECEAAFSRQICDNSTIEKYIREKNYPKESRIVSKESIDKLGLITFFYSDASSAIKKEVFEELKGYDGKRLIINEDMYIAYKIIMKGYRIKYCADSQVVHSHKFTLKQLYDRYYDTGIFMKENSHFLSYRGNESGMKLLKYVLKRAMEEMNLPVLINVIPNFAARFLGQYFGKRSVKNK